MYQDKNSAILLETNGEISSSKSNKHIKVRFFFIKDFTSSGEMSVDY